MDQLYATDSVSRSTAGERDVADCFGPCHQGREINELMLAVPPQVQRIEISGCTSLKFRQTPDVDDLPRKQRRKVVRFREFVDGQDWRPGVTKHTQTYACFLRAAHLKVPPQIALKEVIEKIEASGGELLPDQIKRQLMRAYQYIDGSAETAIGEVPMRSISKPFFQPVSLARIASKLEVVDIEEFLKARSPVEPERSTSGSFLSHVFKPGEKVVVFTDMRSQGQLVWEAGSTTHHELPVGGDDGVWYLVNPVDGEFHFNPREAKRSRRSAESVTDFRHLVLESDVADADHWMKALVQMPLKIVAIYRSGGKSIHALVRVDAVSKADWDATKNVLKNPLVKIGADLGAMSAVRLSRLPQAWRGERCQELLFLDPDPNGGPICQKAPRRTSTAALVERELEARDVQ